MEEQEHVGELRKGKEHATTGGLGTWKSRIDAAQQLQDDDTGGALGQAFLGERGCEGKRVGRIVGAGWLHEHEERDFSGVG